MDQEEIKEEEKTETAAAAPKNNPVMMIVLAVLAIAAFVVVMYKSGAISTEDSCSVVPQAAFGQSQSQVWVELDSPATAHAVAEFWLNVPEELPFDYEETAYRVYTKQISEIWYFDEEGTEIVRISKGIMCGGDIYTANETYNCNNIVEVGDLKVTEMGNDLESVVIATWVDGDYSYFIGAWNSLSKEEMEALILEIE